MRRVCVRLSFALLLLLAPGGVTAVRAFCGNGPALTVSSLAFVVQTQGAEAAPKEKPARANQDASDTAAQGGRRDLARLRRLHERMTKTFDLSASQRETIDGLFREHMQALRDHRAKAGPSGRSAVSPKLKQLRKRIVAAREAGDEAALSALRTEYRQAMSSPQATAAPSTAKFLKLVEAELSQEQRSEFRSLVRRLRIGAFPRAGQRDWRNLWRAVLSPDVGLSERQRKTVTTLLREGRSAAGTTEPKGEAKGEAGPTLRDRVMAELTPEQRTKVEVALKTMKKRRWRPQAARPQKEESTRPDEVDDEP